MNDLNDQMAARRDKLNRLRNGGIEPYPHSFSRTHSIKEITGGFNALLADGISLRTAGRISRIAKKGKMTFMDITDESEKIQLVFSKNEIPESYDTIKALNHGDIIGTEGIAFLTLTQEKSVRVSAFQILAKSLRPLPVSKQTTDENGNVTVFDEFTDAELRYRRRPVDLLLNKNSMTVFADRSRIISCIRRYLDGCGYAEVQTPVLQNSYGGANARPFRTSCNALDTDVYLRISNELFLKQCIVGGFPKVYEIGKDFRNEGIDRTHSPEFTMIEFYETYADYKDMMKHFENIFYEAAMAVHGSPVITYEDRKIDLSTPWKRITFYEALQKYAGIDAESSSKDQLASFCKSSEIDIDESCSKGELLIRIFEETVEEHLIQPHIVYDYPKESTPLCKTHRDNPELVEQFEPYINGWEMGNAYTELNDPLRQRQLLTRQSEQGRGGSEDDHPADEAFLEALEYGMPPTGGAGIGIDRMVMLITNSRNIRDVILFPLMKPVQ